jgi:hypothetical protein
MIWIQLLGAVFALDMMFITYIYHRRGVLLLHDSIIWISVWTGLLLSAVFPQTLEIIVEPLQFLRLMDFLAVAASFLMFSLIFAVFLRSRSNDRKIEKIVREFALREAEEK